MKVGGANQQAGGANNAANDPLSLNALSRQRLRDGVFDPTSLGMQQTRLREQYVATVRAIPTTKYRAPAIIEAAAAPRPAEEGKNDTGGDTSSSNSSSSETKSDSKPEGASSQPSVLKMPGGWLMDNPQAAASSPPSGSQAAPSSSNETTPPATTTTVSRMAPGCYVEDSCSICLCPFEDDGDENLVKVHDNN